MRLVKDGKIYLDGTLKEEEKEELVFKKYEELEDLEEFYGLPLIPLLQQRNILVLDAPAQKEYECELTNIDFQFWCLDAIRLEDGQQYSKIPFNNYNKTWRFIEYERTKQL